VRRCGRRREVIVIDTVFWIVIDSFFNRNRYSFLNRNRYSFLNRNRYSFLNRNRYSFLNRNRYSFLSNRNRLNWPKMKCNRLHCHFNRNRRLLSRLNLEIFTQHHCAMNSGCGGWVSSFIIVYYDYVSGEVIYPSMRFTPRQSRGAQHL